ncbi:aminopeptidase [Bordetella genomosp. 11]|uniref:Aminopeptidase n=2 Tax=Bordetella genomosp. 11 TaxID=1416808 RepID=A0A261UQ15_9BORD|nr:aminopeptidase [Bordetella genomosp. 11]
MKILYTNFHRARGVGGHTSYIARLAAALAQRHSVSIAAPARSALERMGREMPGVRTHAQEFPSSLHQVPAALRQLNRLLREQQYDIVHVNGSSDHRLVLLASLTLPRRPKIVLTKHNDHRIRGTSAWLRMLAGTDHVIAVCEHVKRRLARSPYARRGVTRVFNGIDTRRFTPPAEAARPALREKYFGSDMPDRIVLGSNAGTSDYKGWMYMVRAVAELPHPLRRRFHVAVAGARPSAEDLDEVRALSMQEHFTYAGDLDDVRPFLAAIDIGFVLSHRIETISFACREMMATGKPVIVTSHCGLPENITPGIDGWVVPPCSSTAISTLLKSVQSGAHDIARMGTAARGKAVSEFGIDPFIAGTEHVYLSLMNPLPGILELYDPRF